MERWSENEINEAIELCNSGKNYKEIAGIIGRTPKAIKVRLNRLGIKLNEDVNYETVVCGCCGNEFKSLKNDGRKFCSSSCSATFNNKLRIKLDKYNERNRKSYELRKKNNCLNCGEITTNKYCNSSCQNQYNKKLLFIRIENGEDEINVRQIKKYLIEKHGEKCMECGWDKKHPITGKVPIELEHVDGNSENNRLDNLKLLCPNCHSLTPTYKALNTGNGRHSRRERYKEGKSY